MKLLLDENLSPRLALLLADLFPESAHVRSVGLLGKSDQLIWIHALTNGFVIVSKDTDFRDRSFVVGAPPKIIWLDVGNAGTQAIHWLLRREHQRIESFGTAPETSMLILAIGPSAI